ncbi:MAG: hypothetical protein JZU65_22925 [Chlorobium sp.]|nr:hypothetical protein [Chlorobium sp.]
MSSSFSWLDYSEAERRKALEIADSFKNRDTRDELGIGTVRDALANLFFPGTTTIQTRARYFLFIPWIYLGLEQKFRKHSFGSMEDLAKAARKEEIALIDVLKNSDDADGTIGVEARETLKRLPSNVYWYGMGSWGVRKVDASQDEYHKRLVKYGSPVHALLRGSDDADDLGAAYNWHPALQALKPSDFPQKASFTLSNNESQFLKERIKGKKGRNASLLAVLADSDGPWKPLNFAWEHESAVNGNLPLEVGSTLAHARNFSEVMHGAALLYNLMIARRFFDSFSKLEEKITFYEAEIGKWGSMITSRKDAYATWDRNTFWQIVAGQNAGVPNRTKSFINAWLDLALTGNDPEAVATSENAQDLLLNRERSHKPTGMARLVNENALRQWSGAAGASQLDFRWGVSQRLLTDILSPAENDHA